MKDKKLVELVNNQAVTSSIQVSKVFEKTHQHVLRDIDYLKKDVSNFGHMFVEHNIPDSYGRDRRGYYMTKDGFTLLVMGYTGSKAMQFKLAYINQFNEMEATIKANEKPLTATEKVKLVLQATDELDGRVSKLENSMRIDGSQEKTLLDLHHSVAFKALGGKDSNAYKVRKLRDRVFRTIWSEFKKAFDLPRYGELPKSKFKDGKEFLNSWRPNTELFLEIKKVNSQLKLL